MPLLKLADLIKQGLELNKEEANQLLSAISQHAQHHPEDGVVFEGEQEEEKPAKKETAAEKKAREKTEAEAKKIADEAYAKAVSDYTELFKEAPAEDLSTEGIQKLIDDKISE